MRTSILIGLLLAIAWSRPAFAGDPCPIGFAVIDLGVPAWAKPELKAEMKDGDPFFAKLVAVAKKQECTELVTAKRSGDRLPLRTHDSVKIDLRMKTIEAALYAKNRAFLCDTAGKKLRALYEASYNGAPVLVLRGHRRILIVTAGWRSTCIDAEKADAMNDADVLAVWQRVTKPYVDDRHANP